MTAPFEVPEACDDDPPSRQDGVDEWHHRHLDAANMRAQDEPWADVAEYLRVAEQTVRNYTSIAGWKALVAYYRAAWRVYRIEQSNEETLDVVLEYKPKVLRALAKQAKAGSSYAAAEFLRAIGFTQKNAALAELLAHKEVGPTQEDGGDITVDRTIDLGDES